MDDRRVAAVESQVPVLTSEGILRRVVKADGLENDPEFVGPPGGRPTDSMTAALNKLKRRVQVKRAERTYLVDVSVTAHAPAKAASIANAIAQERLAEQTDVRPDAARRVSQSLTARLNGLKDRKPQSEHQFLCPA